MQAQPGGHRAFHAELLWRGKRELAADPSVELSPG
jgi:hypothetical protein